jgi:ribosomal-protein-serine acetyltransferase
MFRAQIREGVHLALLEERHAEEAFSRVDQDRVYLREWLPWVDATESVDDILTFIRSSREQFAASKGFAAGIWNQGKFCGTIGSHNFDMLNRKAEIGYWLGRSFQGQGIMTAACRTVVSHLLGEMDLNRVAIHCAKENEKSAAIPLRLGFTEEGMAREANLLHGTFHDLRQFAMLKKDWKPEPSRL